MKKIILLSLIALSVVFSGCQTGLPTNGLHEARSDEEATAACQGAGMSYWEPSDENQTRTWSPDTLRISYELPANTSVLFVATENDTVLGVTHATTNETIVAEGVPFDLSRNLSGTHTVSVRMYSDANGNESFDRDTDTVCRTDGERVQTGAKTIDFSALNSSAA